MHEDAEFLRGQAEKCRWLARTTSDKRVVQTLIEMAQEYESRAERQEKESGRGD